MKMALEMFSTLRFIAVGELLRNAFQLLNLTFCNDMLYVVYILCVFISTHRNEQIWFNEHFYN